MFTVNEKEALLCFFGATIFLLYTHDHSMMEVLLYFLHDHSMTSSFD